MSRERNRSLVIGMTEAWIVIMTVALEGLKARVKLNQSLAMSQTRNIL